MISTEIKIQNAINWIEALLSGEYPQGAGVLGNAEIGYCCWGLGCFIVGKKYEPKDGWDSELYKYIGFKDTDAQLISHLKGAFSLSLANDDAGVSFEDIARHLVVHADEQFEPEVAAALKDHFKDIKD